MLIALYMCHGLTARTSVAVLGTLVSLLLIGLLGSLFIDWAFLSGNTDDNTGLIHGLYPHIDMSGLLLAGVIIGSLGVLDDVTVTQTSAVWELHQADPGMGPRGLYRAAIRIGRDHIASVVNTLVLAYAGAALPCCCCSRSRTAAWGRWPTASWSRRRSSAPSWAPSGSWPPSPSPPRSPPWWFPPTGRARRPPPRYRSPRAVAGAVGASAEGTSGQPAFCPFWRASARILPSSSSRFSSKSPRLRS